MLSSGLVVVAALLTVHGDEGTREEKFRDALVAQNAEPVTDTTKIQRQIDLLNIERPSYIPSVVLIAGGGGLAAVGGHRRWLRPCSRASDREASPRGTTAARCT
jgi:hypothetical protein